MPTQPLWNLGPAPIDLSSVSRTISGALDRAQRQEELDRREERLRLEQEQEKSAGEILGRQAALYAQQGQTPQTQADQLMAAGPSRSLPSFARTEGGQPSQTIRGVIERAAAANEVSPDYLTRMVGVESGFDPNARNPSGAAGLAQFVPGTWKQYGGNASPLNPEANAMAAGAFTKDNQAVLRQQLGRDPTYGELYLAHQQGAGGAAGLLANPDRPAAEVVGLRAVASNLPRGAGDPRAITAGQFASLWTQRFADLDAGRSSTPRQPAPGVPAPQRPAPVTVAENEDQVQAAEAAMMPSARLPAVAAGRAGLPPAADLAAPGAVPAGYTVPPGSGTSRVAVGAPAGVSAAAASAPAAPAPAAVLSQGLRAAAQAGMPPQQLAIVQAMAMNPKLQSFAAQIIGKYAAPERQALQRFTGEDKNEYAFDPGTGRVVQVAGFARQPDYQFEKLDDGRVVAIDKRDPTRSITAAEGVPAGGRPMSPAEKASFGIPENTGAYVDSKGQPHTLPGTSSTNVSVAGEKVFEQKEGEAASKRFSALQDAGDAAKTNAPQIGELGEIFARVPVQGKAAEWKQALGPYAQTFGIDVANLSDIQTAEAIVQRIAPQQHVAGTGSQSDLEYKGLIRSLPTLMQDPQTRATTLAFFQSQNDLAVQKGDIVTAMRSGDLSRGEAEKALRALPDPLTRFREFRKENQAAFGAGLKNAADRDRGKAAPAAGGPPVGTVVGNHRFKGGNPNDQASWEQL